MNVTENTPAVTIITELSKEELKYLELLKRCGFIGTIKK